MTKKEQYAVAIADAILSLFRDEEEGGNPNFHFKISEVDATRFFTEMVTGCRIVFEQLTSIEKNNFEFTHLLNQLVVQDLLENKESKDE